MQRGGKVKMMEDNNYLEEDFSLGELARTDTPNEELSSVCNDLFFGTTELAGNIGVKSLGFIVSAPTEQFEAYLDSLNAPQMNEEEFSQ